MENTLVSNAPSWKRLRSHLLFTFRKEAKANGLEDFMTVEAARFWYGENPAKAKEKAMDVIIEDGNNLAVFDSRARELRNALAHEALYYMLTHE